jgi:hypothetical protein
MQSSSSSIDDHDELEEEKLNVAMGSRQSRMNVFNDVLVDEIDL